MYLIYIDESGNTGNDLNNSEQPVFVLAALVVPENKWLKIETELKGEINKFFPEPRPNDFEIHATYLRNGNSYFRQFDVEHRINFRDSWLNIARKNELKLIYRSITKKLYNKWLVETFGSGIFINPHVAAFALIAGVIDEYLHSLPNSPLGIFISDENKEIVDDIEKSIKILRGNEAPIKLHRIIEKGFFINSSQSLLLQLCDLCAYSARKKEEQKIAMVTKAIDKNGILLLEELIHNGNEAFSDVVTWLTVEQQKKSGQGHKSKVG